MTRVYWCEEGKHEFVVPDEAEILQYCPLHPTSLGILLGEISSAEEEKALQEIEISIE